MADHAKIPANGHPDMDYAEHEGTYKGFITFAEIGTVACLAIVVALAVGGVKHAWGISIFGTIATLVATVVAIASPSIGWRAPAVPFGLLLVALALL